MRTLAHLDLAVMEGLLRILRAVCYQALSMKSNDFEKLGDCLVVFPFGDAGVHVVFIFF